MKRMVCLAGLCFLLSVLLVPHQQLPQAVAAELDTAKAAESDRIKVIDKVKPAVVAVFARGGRGGGSGVLIDPEGYALTNFHVTAGPGNFMQAGLPDGVLYEAVLVGLDKVGDVALIKLIPKKEGDKFPFVELGDSDTVKQGDWSLAMGNPFLLATDFTPSVSFGIVSGVNRYQYPEGQFLEYTDCIQFDTTINPGNSGGPLFNMKGQLIGINGRGSFAQDKRFRINCGVGYAISMNQIKNFLGHLYAGIDTDHATLGARVESTGDDADLSRMIVREILDDVDAQRRGLQEGDELISFAGRPITSVNHYKNILGIFPKDWRLPLVFRRNEKERKEVLVRLQSYQANVIQPKQSKEPQPPRPQPKEPEGTPVPAEVRKLFKEKKGYANFYFNELAQTKTMERFKKLGDFSSVSGDWAWEGIFAQEGRNGRFSIQIIEEVDPMLKAPKPKSIVQLNDVSYALYPLQFGKSDVDKSEPPRSGGLAMAMYHLHRFLTKSPKDFESLFAHAGTEPIYLYPLDGSKVKDLKEIRAICEVIRTDHGAIPCKWYFFRQDLNPQIKPGTYPDGCLLAFETFISEKDQDPCEVYFSDYKTVDGKQLPHRFEVRYGDNRFGIFTVEKTTTKAAKK
jgi:S1-C subfamily serine protease